MNLKKLFLDHCEINKYEINQDQLEIIKNLKNFYSGNFNQKILSKILINGINCSLCKPSL